MTQDFTSAKLAILCGTVVPCDIVRMDDSMGVVKLDPTPCGDVRGSKVNLQLLFTHALNCMLPAKIMQKAVYYWPRWIQPHILRGLLV